MSTRTDRAAQIVESITDALHEIHLYADQVTVTTDPDKVDKRGAGQHGIVLVHPAPKFTFPAGGVTRLEWTIYVLSKPGDTLTAFATVDPILDALIARLAGFQAADPGEYETADDLSPAFPGYVVTLQDDFYN